MWPKSLAFPLRTGIISSGRNACYEADISREKRGADMTKKERVEGVIAALDREYGTDLICYLDHETPWQLLIATILSAQCTFPAQ